MAAKSTSPGFTYATRDLAVRLVVTLGVGHAVWDGKSALKKYAGALVRLEPPEDVSDERVAEVEQKLMKFGAAAVKVKRAAKAVLAMAEPEREEGATRRSLREVVLNIVDESKAADVAELRAIVLGAMDRGGL